MPVSRKDFELAAVIEWGHSQDIPMEWLRKAAVFHGIVMVTEGRVREDALLLEGVCYVRDEMALEEQQARRRAA